MPKLYTGCDESVLQLVILARKLRAISGPYYWTACLYQTLSVTVRSMVCVSLQQLCAAAVLHTMLWLCIAARELRCLPTFRYN